MLKCVQVSNSCGRCVPYQGATPRGRIRSAARCMFPLTCPELAMRKLLIHQARCWAFEPFSCAPPLQKTRQLLQNPPQHQPAPATACADVAVLHQSTQRAAQPGPARNTHFLGSARRGSATSRVLSYWSRASLICCLLCSSTSADHEAAQAGGSARAGQHEHRPTGPCGTL